MTSPTPSPDARKFPPVPKELRSKNPLGYLKFYGPGAIIASVTVGGGETIFASRGEPSSASL